MPTLTTVENVQIPMFEAPWTRRERIERAERLITEVGLAHRRTTVPASSRSASASGSQSLEPWRMIPPCYSPTSRPETSIARIRTRSCILLQQLRRERRLTMVIVTHSHDVAQAADRRIAMKDGRVEGG